MQGPDPAKIKELERKLLAGGGELEHLIVDLFKPKEPEAVSSNSPRRLSLDHEKELSEARREIGKLKCLNVSLKRDLEEAKESSQKLAVPPGKVGQEEIERLEGLLAREHAECRYLLLVSSADHPIATQPRLTLTDPNRLEKEKTLIPFVWVQTVEERARGPELLTWDE